MKSAERRFTRLYDTHYRAIVGYFLRRVGSSSLAHDLAEDVFLVAWRKLDHLPRGDEGLYWLYGLAKKLLWNHNRKAATRIRLGHKLRVAAEPTAEQPEDQVVRNDDAKAVIEALGALRDADQEVIRLAYWDELPHAVIGELMGCSRSAVDVRLHRAVRRLRKAMARSGHFQAEELALRAQKETGC